MRGIGKTVTHINELITRLSVLRRGLVVKPVVADLNELVDNALKCLGTPAVVELVRDAKPVPKIPLDPSQVEIVITNLLLNAREALGPGGRIDVKMAVVTVGSCWPLPIMAAG